LIFRAEVVRYILGSSCRLFFFRLAPGALKKGKLMAGRNLTKEKIFDIICKSRAELSSLGVRSIGLFGSYARGKAKAQSDVDILVEFDPEKKTFDNFMDACFLLEDLLGRRVELVTKESLSPYIGPYVLEEVEYVPIAG
jgi:predicted nucleotidyltransferase